VGVERQAKPVGGGGSRSMPGPALGSSKQNEIFAEQIERGQLGAVAVEEDVRCPCPRPAIEPVEIMPDAGLPNLRLFADRWLCCVWDGNAEVGDCMTMETYLRLGHLVYPRAHRRDRRRTRPG